MEADSPKQWPSAQIDTTITVITPWIRRSLLQLTMADPVKVMLVTHALTYAKYFTLYYIFPSHFGSYSGPLVAGENIKMACVSLLTAMPSAHFSRKLIAHESLRPQSSFINKEP